MPLSSKIMQISSKPAWKGHFWTIFPVSLDDIFILFTGMLLSLHQN